MMDSTMNLVNGFYNKYERREHNTILCLPYLRITYILIAIIAILVLINEWRNDLLLEI